MTPPTQSEPLSLTAIRFVCAIVAGLLTSIAFDTHGLQNVVVGFFWISLLQAAWRWES